MIDKSVPFEKLVNLAVNGETLFEDDEDFIRSRLFIVDDLLCHIIAYSTWKTGDKKYDETKSKLLEVGIVYEMLFMIVEDRNEEDFVNNLSTFKSQISDFYQRRYQNLDKCLNFTTNFMLLFIIAAMKHNKRKVIDAVLENETFNNLNLIFPENIDTGSIYNYVALKLLQCGHYIGRKQIPSCWMTPKVMDDFLDSQVTHHGLDLIEINCSFMLHPQVRKTKVETEADVNNALVFWEETDTLSFLLKNENVKHSIAHPVVSTYVNLKSRKFYRIYFWNLMAFLVLFVLPFFLLISSHFVINKPGASVLSSNESETITTSSTFSEKSTSNWEIFLIVWSTLGLIYAILREVFQFWFLEKKKIKRYLRKLTNWLEVLMIVYCIVFLVFFSLKNMFDFVDDLIAFLSVPLVVMLAIEVLCLIPITSSQQYTMIIKNVASSFPKFFVFFGLMLVPFSFCFCIIFQNNTKGEFFENFQSFWTSLFKLSLMLAGEYNIELVKLNVYEMIFVSFFVLTTFWLYALIIGFSVNDIKDLRDNARNKILAENAKKILHLKEFFYKVYYDYR